MEIIIIFLLVIIAGFVVCIAESSENMQEDIEALQEATELNKTYISDNMRSLVDVEKKIDKVLETIGKQIISENETVKVTEDEEKVNFTMPKSILNEWYEGAAKEEYKKEKGE